MAKSWGWATTVVVAVASGAIGLLGSHQLGIPGAWPVVIAIGSFLFTGLYLGMYLVGDGTKTGRDHDEDGSTRDLP